MKEYLRLIALLVALFPCAASAHKPTDSYLRLKIEGREITGTWEIGAIDFANTAKFDWHNDHETLKGFALEHLYIASSNARCDMRIDNSVKENEEEAPTIRLKGECPLTVTSLSIDFSSVLVVDEQYRELAFVEAGGRSYTSALSAENPTFTILLGTESQWQQFQDYQREGMWHIWTGYDHILFLISLLLSAPYLLVQRKWLPREGLAGTFGQVLKIVTAFTLAHSITLGLVIFDIVSLPSRLVESTIAASIAFAATNNLRPTIYNKLWLLTFGFGLIHGMGFADALKELGLPDNARWLVLLAFNLGVEIGQIAIVIALLPLIFLARKALFIAIKSCLAHLF